MPDRVYVVMGTTGEYSDREEWPVAAYFSEADAQSHVALAAAGAPRKSSERKNPYDPDMRTSYIRTTYYVLEVPLLSTVPKVDPQA